MAREATIRALAALLAAPVFAGIAYADFSKFTANVQEEQDAHEEEVERAKKAPPTKSKSSKKAGSDTFSISNTPTTTAPKAAEFPRGSAEADFAAIYRAYLAANGSAVDVDAVAVDYYEVFGVAAGKVGGNKTSSACKTYSKKWAAAENDAGARNELIKEARAFFGKGREQAKSAPKTVKVRMRTTGVLGPYERSANAFEIEVKPLPAAIRAPRSLCQVSDGATKGRNLAPRGRFKATVKGKNADAITTLPMPESTADAYLRSHPKRDVDFLIDVKVGPIQARGGQIQPAPVELLGAKALDPKTGRTLKAYTKSDL